MQFALRPLASGIKMTILLPAPPATKLKPVIPPESGHLGLSTFFACNHNGVGPTTRSRQPHACRSNQTLSPMPSALHADVCSVWARWLHNPCRLGDPHLFRAGGKNRSGPLVGKVAMSPLPSRGFPPLQSGGQNQKWPTCGQGGYITPAASGIPTASERGAKSEMAPKRGRNCYVTPAFSAIPKKGG